MRWVSFNYTEMELVLESASSCPLRATELACWSIQIGLSVIEYNIPKQLEIKLGYHFYKTYVLVAGSCCPLVGVSSHSQWDK